MRILADTPIWSLALRRNRGDLSRRERLLLLTFQDLIHSNSAILIGPVRQEILSGIENQVAFERTRDGLSAFPNEPLDPADDEEAARCFNRFVARGVASSAIDCLICAVAMNRRIPIFTLDADFEHYRNVVPIELFKPSAGRRPLPE
ncbi:MAG: PIN domain-containing protein [Planctomycetes bacterium]|nr:PIN domain-containing protein [Planctomycetota bacterium]